MKLNSDKRGMNVLVNVIYVLQLVNDVGSLNVDSEGGPGKGLNKELHIYY